MKTRGIRMLVPESAGKNYYGLDINGDMVKAQVNARSFYGIRYKTVF